MDFTATRYSSPESTQEGLDTELHQTILYGSAKAVQRALDKGGDIRRMDDYYLLMALERCKENSAKLKLVSDAILGPDAFGTLLAMQALGYQDRQIFSSLRAMYQNTGTRQPSAPASLDAIEL